MNLGWSTGGGDFPHAGDLAAAGVSARLVAPVIAFAGIV